MPEVKANVIVVKEGRKWCAFAAVLRGDPEAGLPDPPGGVMEGGRSCSPQRSVAIGRALAALGGEVRKVKPFGALGRAPKAAKEPAVPKLPVSKLTLPRLSPHSPETARTFTAAGTGREGRKGQGYVYIKDTLQHGPVVAATRTHASGCVTKGGGPRLGQVDLVFVPRANKTGAPAGPALRFCSAGEGFGPLVPVENPKTAREIARKYQTCAAKTDGAQPALEACVAQAAGRAASALPVGRLAGVGALKSYPRRKRGR